MTIEVRYPVTAINQVACVIGRDVAWIKHLQVKYNGRVGLVSHFLDANHRGISRVGAGTLAVLIDNVAIRDQYIASEWKPCRVAYFFRIEPVVVGARVLPHL